MPDKAIDVIDEAGARQRLFNEDERKELIDTAEIEEIIAKLQEFLNNLFPAVIRIN